MAFVIAVSGKGGTGKTTFASLIIRYLLNKKQTPILAVDADANANLNQLLGLELDKTLGTIREESQKEIRKLPAGITKESFLEFRIQEALIEGKGLDLIAMGRPEGDGCYCYVNSILRKYLDTIGGNYKYIVIDNEAGMEHLSRRTTEDVDILFIVSDGVRRGVETAGRIAQLVKELNLNVGRLYLVINRADEEAVKGLSKEIEERELDLIGYISIDKLIIEYDDVSKPLIELPDSSSSVQAVGRIMEVSLDCRPIEMQNSKCKMQNYNSKFKIKKFYS